MDPFVPATLEPLRDCGHLTLESKRRLACVNQEGKRIFTEHLRQQHLRVTWEDCTLSNARFVIDHLLLVRDDLVLVAEGEKLRPEGLPLSELKYEPRIKLIDKKGVWVWLSPTAAFFLGHLLAHSECVVRLTTGKTKRLSSLRLNPEVYLSDQDTCCDSDRLVMAPSLHQNAIRRIRACISVSSCSCSHNGNR